MDRARSFRLFATFCVAAAVWLVPTAEAADCSSDGLVNRTVGTLLRTVDNTGLLSVCDPPPQPDPEPATSPDPAPTQRTEARATDTPPPAASQPSEPPRNAADLRATTPVAAPVPEPIDRGVNPPSHPIHEAPIDEVPVADGTMQTTATAAAGALAVLIAGLVGLVIGRRHARRSVFAVTGTTAELVEDGMILLDGAGRIEAINPSALRILDLIDASTDVSAYDRFPGVTDQGIPLGAWLRNARAAATSATLPEHRPVRIATAPVPGARTRRLVLIRDITGERKLEEMKGQLLATVGHELRTPLTSALGFARLIAERDISPERASSFAVAIVDACERLQRVIDLLIEVSAVENGRIDVDADTVDLAALVGERAERWQQRIPSHVISTPVAGRLPRISANRALLRHAIDELIDNAVKFSPDGGLVTIDVGRTGEGIRIAVADQGVGIDHEHADRIFQDFQQADMSETRRFGGLGLGLAFVRRVARAHGGTVEFSSEEGSGSTFVMHLPVRRPLAGRAPSERPRRRITETDRPVAVRV